MATLQNKAVLLCQHLNGHGRALNLTIMSLVLVCEIKPEQFKNQLSTVSAEMRVGKWVVRMREINDN